MLLVGGFLATPYAFAYDMPALTFAILLVLREAVGADAALRSDEAIALCLGLLIPYGAMVEWFVPIPLSAVSLAALFAVLVRRCLRGGAQEGLGEAATQAADAVAASAAA